MKSTVLAEKCQSHLLNVTDNNILIELCESSQMFVEKWLYNVHCNYKSGQNIWSDQEESQLHGQEQIWSNQFYITKISMTVFKNMVTSIKTWKAPSTKLSDKSITDQAPVIKRVDKAIHWINFYPVDNTIASSNTDPLYSNIICLAPVFQMLAIVLSTG